MNGKPEKTALNLYIAPSTKAAIQDAAAVQRLSVSDFISRLFWQYVEQKTPPALRGLSLVLPSEESRSSIPTPEIQPQIKPDLAPTRPGPAHQTPAPSSLESTREEAPRPPTFGIVKNEIPLSMEERITIARRKLAEPAPALDEDHAPRPRRRFVCSEPFCKQPATPSGLCVECSSLAEARAQINAPRASEPPAPPLERPDCEVCSNRRFTIAAGETAISALPCTACALSCDLCTDGQILTTINGCYEAWTDCSCQRAPIDRALRALNASEIPATYSAALFGKLPAEDRQGRPYLLSFSQMEAHRQAFSWALNYAPGKTKNGLFFHGPPGTGKTLALCRALALIAKSQARAVKYLHFPAYLDLRKASFNAESEIQSEAPAELVAPAVLVVDEIILQGRGAPRSFTEWERSQFDLLVHGRWLAGKPTLYATNYSPETIAAEVSEATFSRIKSTSAFLEVKGRDLR